MRKKLHRDKKKELDRDRKMKDEAFESVNPLKQELHLLRQELEEKEKQMAEMEEDRKILGMLYEKGVIDDHGNLVE